MVHAADFFGSVKKYQVAMDWSTKVCSEFSAQSNLELMNGIPQTPYLKGLDDATTMAKGEIGFLQVIVKPLWETINRFTKGSFRRQVENMEETIAEWKRYGSIEWQVLSNTAHFNRWTMYRSMSLSGRPVAMNSSKRSETISYLFGWSGGNAFLVFRARSKKRRLRVLLVLMGSPIRLFAALMAFAM